MHQTLWMTCIWSWILHLKSAYLRRRRSRLFSHQLTLRLLLAHIDLSLEELYWRPILKLNMMLYPQNEWFRGVIHCFLASNTSELLQKHSTTNRMAVELNCVCNDRPGDISPVLLHARVYDISYLGTSASPGDISPVLFHARVYDISYLGTSASLDNLTEWAKT